ncbi:MAG TPA: beta-L-arabinofuranosidase domain-containing protein [Acidobacteriota bacterium]|nr:beta-L-arabinofuranosidase domain-containing protein [Acidobacteriota bacterium]
MNRPFRAGFVSAPAILLAFALAAASGPVKPAIAPKARPLPLGDVRLTGGPLKAAQDRDADYLLSLSPDRMMAFLRKAAGLEPKAEGYGGWDGDDRQLTGHIAGHYLSGVSLMYAATGDRRFKERADYLVAEMRAVQDKHGDGYIGAQTDRAKTPGKVLYGQVAEGDIRSSGFDLNGMWSPWYVQHKIFAGLRDAYRFAGSREALEVETRFAAWVEGILARLDDAQIQKMLGTEFGGMNEVLVDLYADTGDRRWLLLADRFDHRAVVEPLERGEDILRGKHGNTQVPKLLGVLARYRITGRPADGAAATFFWERVALHHSFATGGHGRNEYFGEPDKFDDMIDGRTAETCNVYNMIKMTRALFALDPQIRYADFHERALFNHILGSMDPSDGATCYMVPVGQGVVREYQDMQEDFTCCVGSGMESHALHGDGIYYVSGDTLWVNIYAPSTAAWREAGVRATMATSFPEGEAAGLALEVKKPRRFTIALRRPFWAGEGFSVSVNGVPVKDPGPAGSYIRLDRTWKTGDKVTLALPKALRLEPLPDNPERAAILWGPLVLAGDLGPIPPRQPRDEAVATAATAAQWPKTPVLVTAATSPDEWIKPAEGRPGVFRTAGAGRERDVDLVPFYRLHRRVYAAYWDILTPGEWDERAAAMKAAEEARRKLESATVAFAQPGQMQSERDFNQQGGKTSPVQLRGRYGRRAVDWFSFDIAVDPSAPMTLVVTYHRDERADRAFAVLVDGLKVGDERIARRSPQEKEGFFDVVYPIPAEAVAGKAKVTVRFEGVGGLETGTVFGIRIVRADKRPGL